MCRLGTPRARRVADCPSRGSKGRGERARPGPASCSPGDHAHARRAAGGALMSQVRRQEMLEGVRIDWMGTGDAPESVKMRAREEVQQLSKTCRSMRAMEIECRPEDCRLSCSCLERGSAIRVTRPTLLEALWAFQQTLRARCGC